MRWESGFAASALALAALAGTGAGAQGKKTAAFTVTAVHTAPGMEISIVSKVWVTQKQARANVSHPLEGEMIYLVNSNGMYQLQPSSKKGIKGDMPPEMKKAPDLFEPLVAQFAFDASGVLQSAKKVRSEKVSGYDCDVYSQSMTKEGITRTITVWMPKSGKPSFPIKAIKTDRTVINKPGAKIDQTVGQQVTLSAIKLDGPIDASLFKLPTGYNVVSGTPKPPTPPKQPGRK